jgi:hypothetical protein
MASTTNNPIVADIETYLAGYLAFQDNGYRFTAALWTLGTYLWHGFSTFPYMVITSDTKRSGKTTLAELLSFVSNTPRNIAGVTVASVLRMMRDERASLFIDEAESLSSDAQTVMKAVLNVGYRRGQTIPRAAAGKEGNEYWPVYGPKCFILIGDVYDTLRDRSVIVYMKRANAPQRYRQDVAEGEGLELAARIRALIPEVAARIHDTYARHGGLPFLSGRDEEIWLSLVAICEVLAPSRLAELHRVAMDIATEKTAPARTVKGLQDAEDSATASEYGMRLLQDMGAVVGESASMFTDDVLTALKAMPLAPWRKFRGTGLDGHDIGNMLQPFGVRPKNIRSKGGRKSSVVRKGYKGVDIWAALRSNNLVAD